MVNCITKTLEQEEHKEGWVIEQMEDEADIATYGFNITQGEVEDKFTLFYDWYQTEVPIVQIGDDTLHRFKRLLYLEAEIVHAVRDVNNFKNSMVYADTKYMSREVTTKIIDRFVFSENFTLNHEETEKKRQEMEMSGSEEEVSEETEQEEEMKEEIITGEIIEEDDDINNEIHGILTAIIDEEINIGAEISEDDLRRLYMIGFTKWDIIIKGFLTEYARIRVEEDEEIKDKLKGWMRKIGKKKEIENIDDTEDEIRTRELLSSNKGESEKSGNDKDIKTLSFHSSQKSSSIVSSKTETENTTDSEDNLSGIENLFQNRNMATQAEVQAMIDAAIRVADNVNPDGAFTAFVRQGMGGLDDRIQRVEEE